jgi:pantoate--beta-alanine ligase
MTKQLQLPIEIVVCDIVREEDGLAMSSRNVRLTMEERKIATQISKTLFKINHLQNQLALEELKNLVAKDIALQPKIHLHYFEIVNGETLETITNFSEAKTIVACIAVTIGKVRLIDNIQLKNIK